MSHLPPLARIAVIACVALLGLALGSPPARADLDAAEERIVAGLNAQATQMRGLLAEWVAINTGTFHLQGLERFAGQLAGPLRALGFRVEVRPGPEIEYPDRGSLRTGPIVFARRVARAKDAPRLLLSGHYDTVFEPDSEFQELRVDPDDPGRALGPGASDMKGGLVVLLYALRALAKSGDLDGIDWTLLIDGDEEIGSLGSRPQIEAAARQADYGFVFESARPQGDMVKSRRGLGQFFLSVEGVPAHAGSAHEEGRSAVLALAHKIIAIEGLTDYRRGVTLNTGVVRGGSKRNIVPARAEAWIDVRYDAPELGELLRGQLEQIAGAVHVAGTRGSIWGELHRPPKLETAPVRRLLEVHAGVTSDLGLSPPAPVHAGGGTDGSLMAGVGLSTLDSMGVRGGAAHTEKEFVALDSLPERAAIAAILFRRLPALRP